MGAGQDETFQPGGLLLVDFAVQALGLLLCRALLLARELAAVHAHVAGVALMELGAAGEQHQPVPGAGLQGVAHLRIARGGESESQVALGLVVALAGGGLVLLHAGGVASGQGHGGEHQQQHGEGQNPFHGILQGVRWLRSGAG